MRTGWNFPPPSHLCTYGAMIIIIVDIMIIMWGYNGDHHMTRWSSFDNLVFNMILIITYEDNMDGFCPSHLPTSCVPIQIWWSFTTYYSMMIIVVTSYWSSGQVGLDGMFESQFTCCPTHFSPNMTFATQLLLKKRQKKNRTLTKHSFNWAGIRMHMHRNLFNSKQVWITGLPVKRSVSYRVCHF